MFLGHYGIAFAAKRAAPRTSLGALTFAAEFLDELWPILLLAGVEHVRIVPGLMAASPLEFTSYPYSHSLLMALVWAALIGAIYFASRRYGRGGWILALLVVSHWVLDVPMHAKDLPITPWSDTKLGWGLWNSVPATYVIEFAIYAIGIAIYLRATRARDKIGVWGLWAYIVVLAAIFLSGNRTPPPSERALALTTLFIWLFVPWAYWVDKHRYTVVRTVTTEPSKPTR
ncbi:MAG TPA: hypothetical protein VGD02_01200 [Gemmatimonadaceae bacterium]